MPKGDKFMNKAQVFEKRISELEELYREHKREKEELKRLYLELKESHQKFKKLSLVDSHTGLYNHRYLVERAEQEYIRVKKYGHNIAVIMLDIDYFKSINDVYGHQFGDLILKQLGVLLRKVTRKYDIVARYGGEEFVILSPGLTLEAGVNEAERILHAINECNFGQKKIAIRLKVSIGVSAYPSSKASSGVELIDLADNFMGKAKELGGNRVIWTLADAKGKKEDDAADVNVLKNKIKNLTKRANQSLVEAIYALAKTVEFKDHYSGEHVEKSIVFATEIAKRLGLAIDETELIRHAAMLHDLGKVGISEKILFKKSKLTKDEFEVIKKHPEIAVDIIRPVHFLRNVIPLVLYHHERWDGKGYPKGLKGEEIPLGARIIAISDVAQALISKRSYRKAFSKAKVMDIIQKDSGVRFDPKIVEIMLDIFKNEKDL